MPTTTDTNARSTERKLQQRAEERGLSGLEGLVAVKLYEARGIYEAMRYIRDCADERYFESERRAVRRAVERVKQTPPAPPVLVYDPPYATPAADEVAWHLVKYLRDDVEMTCEGETFTLRQGSQVVQIAATVGYALAVHDRLYALSLSHPSMFSERGRLSLKTLASQTGGAA